MAGNRQSFRQSSGKTGFGDKLLVSRAERHPVAGRGDKSEECISRVDIPHAHFAVEAAAGQTSAWAVVGHRIDDVPMAGERADQLGLLAGEAVLADLVVGRATKDVVAGRAEPKHFGV